MGPEPGRRAVRGPGLHPGHAVPRGPMHWVRPQGRSAAVSNVRSVPRLSSGDFDPDPSLLSLCKALNFVSTERDKTISLTFRQFTQFIKLHGGHYR